MKFTEYKFWYIRRDDDGFITEAAIRFYEGDFIQAMVDVPGGGSPRLMTIFKRTARLLPEQIPHIRPAFRKEANGTDVKIYSPEDFGRIKTDEELCAFLNTELSKDTTRQPVPQQRNG